MNKESLASRRQRSTTICAYVFLIPVIVLMAVFLFYPIVQTFINSFTSWNGISANKSFNGIYNWNKLLHDADFWKAFFNNIKIMILSLVIQMPIGILLATFLDTGGRKYNFFKVIWFLPLLMSSVAVGYLFHYVLATNGGIISGAASADPPASSGRQRPWCPRSWVCCSGGNWQDTGIPYGSFFRRSRARLSCRWSDP